MKKRRVFESNSGYDPHTQLSTRIVGTAIERSQMLHRSRLVALLWAMKAVVLRGSGRRTDRGMRVAGEQRERPEYAGINIDSFVLLCY